MTPKEVWAVMEGYYWRRDDKYQVESVFFAGVLNMLKGKKGGKIKPQDLYRPVLKGRGEEVSVEERQERFERAVQKMGPDAIPVRPRRRG